MALQCTPGEMRRLAGKEFNAILAADPVLAQMEADKYDRRAESLLLLEVLRLGSLRIGNLPVLPLTAAKWAFLWMLESPYTTGGEIHPADIDLMLYVLSIPSLAEVDCAPHEIPSVAAGMMTATGLDFAEAHDELRAVKATAFQPLELLPPDPKGDDGPPRFDALWITRIAGVAARESGERLHDVMHGMSLSCVCCMYVNWRIRESLDGYRIYRRPDAELSARISARVDALAAEYLRKPKQP